MGVHPTPEASAEAPLRGKHELGSVIIGFLAIPLDRASGTLTIPVTAPNIKVIITAEVATQHADLHPLPAAGAMLFPIMSKM